MAVIFIAQGNVVYYWNNVEYNAQNSVLYLSISEPYKEY